MEMLLDEIPHATSGHHHHDNGDARAGNDHAHQIQQMHPAHGMHGYAANDDGPSSSHGLLNGHGHAAGHACMCPPPPPPPVSDRSSSSSLSGTLSLAGDDGARRSSAGEDFTMVELGLVAGLRCLSIDDGREALPGLPPAPAPPLANDVMSPFLFRNNHANNLGFGSALGDVYGAPRRSVLPNSGFFDVDGRPYGSGLQQHCFADADLSESWHEAHWLDARGSCSNDLCTATENFLYRGEAIGADGAFDANLDYEGARGSGFPSSFLRLPHKGVDLGRDLNALNSLSPVHASLSKHEYYSHLMGIEGYMCYIAKNQHGCRFLQRKFDEGRHVVDFIFNGIIDHIVELMVDPFGNYLMQKLLAICSEEQRMGIILKLTEDAEQLVRISLNIHGTRAVQKLIETLKTRQQIALVISALRPGILVLIKDLNGNHVVQRCLQTFTAKDNKFIFYAATKRCVDIATHQHGCCIMQRCISHSTGEDWRGLVAEISANGLKLAQDCFGNYVVQYILDLKSPLVIANLASQFEGYYVHLSLQKCSSHVVEKCLKVFGEDNRATIILELLSVSQFEQLLQDPIANYVIRSALQNTKGSLRSALVDAIRPHAAILRTSPYCKRIFSQLKK